MSDPIYKGAYTIGNGKSPVVISTSGKVVIKVKDKYFPINYSDLGNTSQSEAEETKQEELPIKIVSPEEVNALKDTLTTDTLVVSTDNRLYLYHSGQIKEVQASVPSDYVANSVTTNKLVVKTAEVVPMLNASYLGGSSSTDFLKKSESATLTGNLTFSRYINIAGFEGDSVYLNAKTGQLNVKKLLTDEIVMGTDYKESYEFKKKGVVLGAGSSKVVEGVFTVERPEGAELDIVVDNEGVSHINQHIKLSTSVENFVLGEEIIYMSEGNGPIYGLAVDKVVEENKIVVQINDPFPDDEEERTSFIEKYEIDLSHPIYQPIKVGLVGNVGPLYTYSDGSAKLGSSGDVITITASGEVVIDKLEVLQEQLNELKNIVNNLQS